MDWVAGLFNAKNVMKPLVDIQQQLNDVQLKGVQNAQSEITKLELLYKATQNASKPIRERKKLLMSYKNHILISSKIFQKKKF